MRFRRKCMHTKSVEILWQSYEKLLDRIDGKGKSIEKLDKSFYDAKRKYEEARAKILNDKDQLEAECSEMKSAMDLLGGG